MNLRFYLLPVNAPERTGCEIYKLFFWTKQYVYKAYVGCCYQKYKKKHSYNVVTKNFNVSFELQNWTNQMLFKK